MIGNIIKDLRQEAGITQAQLAKSINVSQSMIYFWESGTNEPTASNIIALADFFNVSTDFLLGRETAGKLLVPEHIKLYYKMNAEQKRLTIKVMKAILDEE